MTPVAALLISGVVSITPRALPMPMTATPATGYAITIQRSDVKSTPLEVFFEEVVVVRGQNNAGLFADQIIRASDAGLKAACQEGEYHILKDTQFKDGSVTLQITCMIPEG